MKTPNYSWRVALQHSLAGAISGFLFAMQSERSEDYWFVAGAAFSGAIIGLGYDISSYRKSIKSFFDGYDEAKGQK